MAAHRPRRDAGKKSGPPRISGREVTDRQTEAAHERRQSAGGCRGSASDPQRPDRCPSLDDEIDPRLVNDEIWDVFCNDEDLNHQVDPATYWDRSSGEGDSREGDFDEGGFY